MFKRYATTQILDVYKTSDEIKNVFDVWKTLTKNSSNLNISINDKEFPYLPERFLYYRARAITANVVNQNGDRFPHEEINKSYKTFIGKGVYYNHNSQDQNNAFGIILDAVYTPVIYGDTYEDKYVEILAAIDKKLIEEKFPNLLNYILTGKVTGTSMGTFAESATCSVCGNTATNYSNLCVHMHPQSPLFCKGRKVFDQLAYEDNYGLTFIEDSIVYVPADSTAHILEVYANKKINSDYKELIDLFKKYSSLKGEVISKESPIFIYSEKEAPTMEPINTEVKKEKKEPKPSSYVENLTEIKPEIKDSTEKIIDNKIRRIIEEELRKLMSPILTHIDEYLRPKVKTELAKEVEKVKDEVQEVLGTEIKTEQPVAGKEEEGIKKASSNIDIVKIEFGGIPVEERKKIISAIVSGDNWIFKRSKDA